jgi:hypothetical protein
LMMRCVVCWERPVARGDERAYGCAPGCRGRSAVCAECREGISKCVYCRAVVASPEELASITLHIFVAWLMLMTFIAWKAAALMGASA